MKSLLMAALAAAGIASASAADAPYVDSDTVRHFQRSEKLQPTGKLDRQTQAALGVQKADASSKYGATTIRKAQETLNARGFKAGPANGILGETTRSALRAFQKSENIVVTGNLNPRTLARLGIEQPG
jgi:peptidoglycan hydrolase-like protein with peptidoglycan-binding domain